MFMINTPSRKHANVDVFPFCFKVSVEKNNIIYYTRQNKSRATAMLFQYIYQMLTVLKFSSFKQFTFSGDF